MVVPAHNEAATLEELWHRISAALSGLRFELIVVDDGSDDATPEILATLAVAHPQIRVITLSRNFGHQAALTAGLDHARGDVAVMLDADLQDPPELIGGDARSLAGRRRRRLRRFAVIAPRRRASSSPRRDGSIGCSRASPRSTSRGNSGDYRLLDRTALDALGSMRERSRFLRGMTIWVGFEQAAVAYERDARYAGETKYTLRKMVRFSFDAISSFSHVPLQAATVLGFIFSIVAFLAIPVAIGFRIAGQFVPGVTTVLLVVLLLGGIQLITVGIIGEYLGRVYDEVKQRPLYIVRGERDANRPAAHPPEVS